MTTQRDNDGTAAGFGFALASAISFGLAGPVAAGMLAAGWSPGAAVLVRVTLGALVLAPFALRALAGRWGALASNPWPLIAYGVVAVAGTQFAYFSAVGEMDVAPALLIEFTAPAAIVIWLWLRHGERPRPLTLAGAAVAAVGLVLVLNLVAGADLALAGVLWAFAAMFGVACHFTLSARTDTGLPPPVFGCAGLLIGAAALALLGLAGLLPLRATTTPVDYAGASVAWWLPPAVLGIVCAGVAYVVAITAIRILGARLASFVALLEVVAGVVFAWLLLAQKPGIAQLVGGVLILAGITLVRLAERPVGRAARPRTPAA